MQIRTLTRHYFSTGISLLTLAGVAVAQAQPSGQWDFNSGDLAATVGQPLVYATPATQAGTAFGTTTSFGIPDIAGTPANVMRFSAFTVPESYQMPLPNTPNGGGSLINDWTLVLDLLYPSESDGQWRAIIDTDDGLTPDSDFFVNAANGIGISGNYSGQVQANTWHRIALVVESSAGELRKYIDGVEVGVQTFANMLEGRWAMTPGGTADLFTDNDGETALGYVNSIQFRNVALTAGQINAFGGAAAAGIPQQIPLIESFIESRSPGVDAVAVSPRPTLTVVLNAGETGIAAGSSKLFLDDTEVAATVTPAGALTTVSFTPATTFEPLSVHTARIDWTDNSVGPRTDSWSFTVADYAVINLPAPIHLETFDGIAEGELPAGWAVTNLTDSLGGGFDLFNPQSDAYLDFVVINRDTLLTAIPGGNGERRFALNPVVVNGEVLDSLVSGNFAYAESDVRGGNQVQVMITRDYDLTGQNNVFLAWHSMYEQNQDSIGSVEYSIDGGATWLPVVYMIDVPDIIRDGAGDIDAVATLSTARGDQAHGEPYGTWIGAPISEALAPYISGRIDDNRFESKRVELHRIEQADGQSQVRLRFMQAGTASWYFGVDNVGFYSIDAPLPPSIVTQPLSQWVHGGAEFSLSVSAGGTEPLSYQWKRNGEDIPGATDATYTVSRAQAGDAGEYQVIVSNDGGAAPSALVPVGVFSGPIDEQLVVHLKFDNDLTDASGAGHNGEAVGNPTFTDGLIGSHAVLIPSGADYVSLGRPAALDFGSGTDFSISFWARLPEGGWNSDPAFIGNKDWNSGGNQGYVIATDGDGRIQWNLAGAPGGRKDFDGPGGTFGNEDWHHIAVTFDRQGSASTYVDGELMNRKDITEDENNVTTPSTMATNIGQDGTGFYGAAFNNLSVDDLGIWRRVLTPQEVAAAYQAGLLGQEFSTVDLGEVVVPEIGSPTVADGTLSFSWSGDAQTRLQKATRLEDPDWADVDGTQGESSHSEPIGSGNAYFRLVQGQ